MNPSGIPDQPVKLHDGQYVLIRQGGLEVYQVHGRRFTHIGNLHHGSNAITYASAKRIYHDSVVSIDGHPIEVTVSRLTRRLKVVA